MFVVYECLNNLSVFVSNSVEFYLRLLWSLPRVGYLKEEKVPLLNVYL